MGYVLGDKPWRFAVVILCIPSRRWPVGSSLFIQRLIDDYIAPLLIQSAPVFTPLLKALALMACLYLAGVLATLIYNRVMAVISPERPEGHPGRDVLPYGDPPIGYFDTHTYGDVMSYYTNDTDTSPPDASQSIPRSSPCW